MAAPVAVVKTCSRPGCGKQLRERNQSGLCTSGCRSPEAPSYVREGGGSTEATASEARPRKVGGGDDVMKRFRVVAKALGKDPDAILRDAAEEWLAAVAKAVE